MAEIKTIEYTDIAHLCQHLIQKIIQDKPLLWEQGFRSALHPLKSTIDFTDGFMTGLSEPFKVGFKEGNNFKKYMLVKYAGYKMAEKPVILLPVRTGD